MDVAFALRLSSVDEDKQRQRLSLLRSDFISFDERQKKRSKEKRFLDEARSPALSVSAFSDSPILGSVGKRRPSMAAALRVCIGRRI